MRKSFKSCNYTNPDQINDSHCSLSGDILDKDIIGFETLSSTNYDIYMNNLCEGKGYGHTKLQPVFVLTSDRDTYNEISNKTKDQIYSDILALIAELRTLGDYDEAANLTVRLYREVKAERHAIYVTFYHEVNDIVENLRDLFMQDS